MKRLTLHRLASALLCLTLALSLTACGGKKKPAPAAGNGGVKETISDSRTDQTGQADPVKPSEPEAEVDQELVEECLDKLGFDLEYGGYPGAAAYLGYREKGDTSKLSDWMLENCLDLTAEMPVMLTIPSERVLGPGYGKLFCVIPRGENTSLAVNHITWQSQGNGLHPVADEVLYREEYAQPVLLFVDPEEPDMEVNLVADDGTVVNWYPQEDLYGDLILPARRADCCCSTSPSTRTPSPSTIPKAGSRPVTIGGGPLRIWDWPIPRGIAMSGRWSCTTVTATRIMRGWPICTSTITARRICSSSVYGAWRMTACGWICPPGWAAPSAAVSQC